MAVGLRPPVIHRDIKPENVVVEGGKWGGRVYLIDFGGVQGSSGLGGCLATHTGACWLGIRMIGPLPRLLEMHYEPWLDFSPSSAVALAA